MDMSKINSPIPGISRPINQVQSASPGKPSTSMPTTSTSEPYTEYKVRVPRHLAKKYYMMRFQSGKPDLSSITKASMSRDVLNANKEEEALPKSGAGSEFGRERREEARKRRRGYAKKKGVDPDTVPWNLKLGGKGGRRYSGKKEAGIDDNSSYYILTQCPDGAFEAVPVTSWYNFNPNINYRTLTADEAEEEFLRRDRTVNFFSLMVKKRLQKNEEGGEQEKEKVTTSRSRNMRLFDDDDERDSLSDDDDDDDNESKKEKNSKEKQGKSTKQKKGKSNKTTSKTKKGSDDESDASSEEDGYFDSKEVDYMSDSSSSSEEEVKKDDAKPSDTKDDLNADTSESESEDDEDLTIAGKDIKKMLQKGQGEGGSSDEEDEDPDNDEVKGTAAVFLQEKAKGKKKSGSKSSTTSSSRSSTPTAGVDNQAATSTIQAAAKKLEGRPAGKGRKRPASDPVKTGFVSISDSPSSKKARVSPAPNSQSGSASNTPTPSENGNTITEDSVRRYLARKPMTTKDLLQKFKSKKTGLTNEQTVQLIATILKKIQPEQNKIKGKLYLSLKPT